LMTKASVLIELPGPKTMAEAPVINF
jgi:hypothetical protein